MTDRRSFSTWYNFDREFFSRRLEKSKPKRRRSNATRILALVLANSSSFFLIFLFCSLMGFVVWHVNLGHDTDTSAMYSSGVGQLVVCYHYSSYLGDVISLSYLIIFTTYLGVGSSAGILWVIVQQLYHVRLTTYLLSCLHYLYVIACTSLMRSNGAVILMGT